MIKPKKQPWKLCWQTARLPNFCMSLKDGEQNANGLFWQKK